MFTNILMLMFFLLLFMFVRVVVSVFFLIVGVVVVVVVVVLAAAAVVSVYLVTSFWKCCSTSKMHSNMSQKHTTLQEHPAHQEQTRGLGKKYRQKFPCPGCRWKKIAAKTLGWSSLVPHSGLLAGIFRSLAGIYIYIPFPIGNAIKELMFYRFTRSSEWWTAWYFGPMRQDPKPWALFNWEDPVLSPCTCTDSVWWSDVKWSEVKRKPYATELCIYSISYLFIDLKLYIDIFDISINFHVCIYIHIYNHIHILIAAQTTTANLSSSFLTWFSKDMLGLNSGWWITKRLPIYIYTYSYQPMIV